MRTAFATVVLLIIPVAYGQTISSSWGWKSSRVVYGDIAFSYPVYKSLLGTAAYSHSLNGSNGALWGVKHSARWTPHWSAFQQGEVGFSNRHGNHLAAQLTLGVSCQMLPTVSVSTGVKTNKTADSRPFFTLYVGVAKRLWTVRRRRR